MRRTGDVSFQTGMSYIIAVSRGRTMRTREACHVCFPETLSTIFVTAKGPKYHCRGCQKVEKFLRRSWRGAPFTMRSLIRVTEFVLILVAQLRKGV